MLDINTLWDKNQYPTNTSPALTAALSLNQTVYFPAGQYYLENVVLPVEAEIILDGNAKVKGVTSTSNLFTTSAGTWRVRISGGQWTLCNSVIKHIGASALSNCLFERMKFNYMVNPFSISASVGNHWHNCFFADGLTNGIVFETTGQSNANAIERCTFQNSATGVAILFKTGQSKSGNVIRDSWFENLKCAIHLQDSVRVLLIEGCYFEKCGDATFPDIFLDGNVRQVSVDACQFATSNDAQIERIMSIGNSAVVARDNHVVLKANQVFATIGGNSAFMSFLQGNMLNVPTGGDYTAKLFNRTSTQALKYDISVGSGGVTGDDVYAEYLL